MILQKFNSNMKQQKTFDFSGVIIHAGYFGDTSFLTPPAPTQLTSFSMDLRESLEMPGTTWLVSGL
jgi:hypothetical protein